MLFVPLTAFGNRPIGGRLMKNVVPDDESLPAHSFVEVAEDEWAITITETQAATS